MSSIHLAWLNLIRHRFSTLTTLIAITLSVSVGGLLFHLYRLSTSRFESLSGIGNAVVGAKSNSLDILLSSMNLEGNYPAFVPYKLYVSLSEHQAVRFEDGAQTNGLRFARSFPLTFIGRLDPLGNDGRATSARVIATEPNFLASNGSDFPAPHLALGSWDEADGTCTVGSAVAHREHWNIGDTVNAQTWLGREIQSVPLPLKITGILNPLQSSWDDAVFTNMTTARRVLGQVGRQLPSIWGPEVVQYIVFQLGPDQFPALRDLVNSRTVSQAIDVAAERQRLTELTGTGRELGLSIALLIIALGALCVVSMLVARFDALGIQIAVLRASGYSLRAIAGWLIWEGAILGLASVVMGTLVQLTAFPLLQTLLAQWIPKSSGSFGVSIWSSMALVGTTAFLSTLIAAVIPFVRLSRQNIHDALRGF